MEEIRDTTLNMTLGEIHSRDIDNLSLVYKSAKRVVFDSPEIAIAFISKCITRALLKWGIDREMLAKKHLNNPKGFQTELDCLLTSKQVILEKPRKRRGKEAWRSGIYIYYRNEIAFFISFPLKVPWKKSSDAHIIVPGRYHYIIVTNVA